MPGLAESSFGSFCNMLWKYPNEILVNQIDHFYILPRKKNVIEMLR